MSIIAPDESQEGLPGSAQKALDALVAEGYSPEDLITYLAEKLEPEDPAGDLGPIRAKTGEEVLEFVGPRIPDMPQDPSFEGKIQSLATQRTTEEYDIRQILISMITELYNMDILGDGSDIIKLGSVVRNTEALWQVALNILETTIYANNAKLSVVVNGKLGNAYRTQFISALSDIFITDAHIAAALIALEVSIGKING